MYIVDTIIYNIYMLHPIQPIDDKSVTSVGRTSLHVE